MKKTELTNNTSNKLLIYVIFDKNGIVDRYITFLLDEIKKHVSEILVVVNGVVTNESRKTLELITPDILVRENKGFDIWGYKAGLDYYGWGELERFDEIILMNDSVYGPFYPFAKVFDEMDSRDLDFWGMTMHRSTENIPMHIQSYFTAIRKSMHTSAEFINYWDNLPIILSYEDAVVLHEVVFTKRFEDKGFKWGVYADTSDIAAYPEDHTVFNPLGIIRDKKIPFIKRKCFYIDYAAYMAVSAGEITVKAFEYIQNNTDYDTDMIWDNLLRTKNQSDIYLAMALNYILPIDSRLSQCKITKKGSNVKSKKICKDKAVVLYFFCCEDIFDNCSHIIQSTPDDVDIIIITDAESKRKSLLSFIDGDKDNKRKKNIKIVLTKKAEEANLYYWRLFKDIVNGYDLICFTCDIGASKTDIYNATEQASAFKCYQNVLASKFFAENVLSLFENNPRLGMLSPPPPIHSDYYYTIAQEDWRVNYQSTKNLADRIGLKTDICPYKAPIAPLGGMFWFRTAAMKKLFEYDLKCDDFPQEPSPADKSIFYAMERICPYIVQDAGYYPARIYSDTYAPIEIAALNYYLRTLTSTAYELYSVQHNHQNLLSAMKVTDAARRNEYKVIFEKLTNTETEYENALTSISILQTRLQDIQNSTSWKITAPFRKISDFFRIHNKPDK